MQEEQETNVVIKDIRTLPIDDLAWSQWIIVAALSGALWGVLEIIGVGTGFLTPVGVVTGGLAIVTMIAQCIFTSVAMIVPLLVFGKLSGMLGFSLKEDAIAWRTRRLSLRWPVALLAAGMVGSMVFMYGFAFADFFDLNMVGARGIAKPVTPALKMLVALLCGLPLILTPLLILWFKKMPRAAFAFWCLLLVIQGGNLFFVIFEQSKYFHTDKIYFLLFLTLLWWTWPVIAKLYGRNHHPKKLAIALTVVSLVGVFGLKFAIDMGSHQLRMIAYERGALVSNLLGVIDQIKPAKPTKLECVTPVDVPPMPVVTNQKDNDIQGVVLIMVDTLRAERLGAMAPNGKPVSPALNKFASGAIQFDRAYTKTPSTKYTTSALVYGHYDKVKPDAKGLFDILNQAGVATYALPNHKNVVPMVAGAKVQDKVFLGKKDHKYLVNSKAVYEHSLTLLAQVEGDAPFFQFLHYFDAHYRYSANELFDFGYGAWARYNAEVAYVDHWIGKYLEKLKAHRLGEKTLVIIVSDHGEEFGDHRYSHHGFRVYDESSRLMLLVGKSGEESKKVKVPVSVVDIPTTIAGVFGLELPGSTGISLLSEHLTSIGKSRPVYLKANKDKGVVLGHHKLVLNHHGFLEFYNLKADPGELYNLADNPGAQIKPLSCLLKSKLEQSKVF